MMITGAAAFSSGMAQLTGFGNGLRRTVLAGRLHFLKGGADLRGDGTTSEFDGKNGGRAAHKCRDRNAKAVVELAFGVVDLGHIGGDGAEQAITQKNAEKRTH